MCRYLLLENVRRTAGFVRPERYADAIEVSFYRSNKEEIGLTGYEIKCSRNDLLKELRDLEKAETFKQFCNKWILIVGDERVLDGKLRIPEDWGIWIYDQGGTEIDGYFRTAREPHLLYPKPVDRFFLASLIIRAAETGFPTGSRKNPELLEAKK